MIRHDLDPKIVKKTIEAKVESYEQDKIRRTQEVSKMRAEYEADLTAGKGKNWVHPPHSIDSMIAMYDEWIARERNHYALVRIIEKDKKFVLKYGTEPDDTFEGTGPFETLKRAKEWFTNQGR